MRIVEEVTIEEPKELTGEKETPKSRRNGPVNSKVAALLIEQMGNEKMNEHIYQNFSTYYSKEGLPKLAQYYKHRADEENVHYNWIVDFLLDNDVEFDVPGVQQMTTEITDRLMPFEATVDLEIKTTEDIYKIAETACEEKDWITFYWLEKLIMEQIDICLKIR